MYDSYPFKDSVEKEVQLVDIMDDTVQKIPEQIQADPNVFYCQFLLDIHGTKYSYGQPILFIELKDVTYGYFYDLVPNYLDSTLNYKSFILETPFDESEYKFLDLFSSCCLIFLIIHIFGVGSKFLWVDEIFSWLHWIWDYNLIQ